MKKNIIVSTVVGLILTSFYPVQAQQPAKMRKIGFLNRTGAFSANIEAFRQGMRELGYIEGQNIVIEFRSGERGARLTELANELIQQKVDVIVAAGPEHMRPRWRQRQYRLFSCLAVIRLKLGSSTALRGREET